MGAPKNLGLMALVSERPSEATRLIRRVLADAEGNFTEAARVLNTTKPTLLSYVRRLGLERAVDDARAARVTSSVGRGRNR
jgi:transcriptional regulator with GAF, ATPase, and Fis domain